MTVLMITTIKNYIGESDDDKPPDCPAGSTFEELDTNTTYKFDGSNWVVYSINIASEKYLGTPRDLTVIGLLEEMHIALKKIEYHLSVGSDANLKDEDV